MGGGLMHIVHLLHERYVPRVEDGKLTVRPTPPPELQEEIRKHKDELIEALEDIDHRMREAEWTIPKSVESRGFEVNRYDSVACPYCGDDRVHVLDTDHRYSRGDTRTWTDIHMWCERGCQW